jgi:glycosyltransferase involved in cell wall biosynthesis
MANRYRPSVLIVSATPPPYSGPEVMTAQLLNSPLRESYRLIHFNITKGRDVSTKARFDLINIVYGLFQPIQLFWLMLRHRPDIVYTNLAQNLGGFLRYASFVLIVALFRKPIAVRVMGDGFNHFYQRSNPLLRRLICQTLRRIDSFVVRAEALKQQFAGLVSPDKLHVIYSGIDTDEFDQPRTRARDDEVRVLFVGYLTKAKGAFDLLQVIPQITASVPNVKFQLMGERVNIERNITYIHNPGSNEAILQQLLARPHVLEHVELLGVQSGQAKISTFVNADLLVLPSYSEAFPTVVLEAMAAGLPVVATPVGALPEAFDERSIRFVEPGNAQQLAEAIAQMIQNSDCRVQMGSYNRRITQERFSLRAHAAQMSALFEGVLGAPAS